MENEFVTYPIALRLKALGFNEPCLGAFHTASNRLMTEFEIINTPNHCIGISAPTWQTAFKFFRDKYKLYHVIHQFEHKKGTDQEFLAEAPENMEYFKSYEECEAFCLEKLCEIVESKKIKL